MMGQGFAVAVGGLTVRALLFVLLIVFVSGLVVGVLL